MKRRVAYLFMALHVSFAAGTYVFTKPAAVEFADPESLALLRAAGAALLVLALTGTVLPRPEFTRGEWLRVGALGALLVPCNQYVFVRGLQDTVPAHVALLYATTPVVVLVMTALLTRRLPSAIRATGVLTALAGAVLLLRPWEAGPEAAQLRRGDLWISLGVFIWAAYTIAAGYLARRHDARIVTAWSLVIGAILLIPLALPSLLAFDSSQVSVRGVVGLGYLIVVTSVVMMLLWNGMLRHLEPVQVAVCANAQPAATALLAATLAAVGYLRTDQDLRWEFWLGTALVVAGVTLVQRRDRGPSRVAG